MQEIKVDPCACVQACRALNPVIPVADRFEYDGQSTSNGSGPAIGYLVVRCAYCKTVLKSIDGFQFGTEE